MVGQYLNFFGNVKGSEWNQKRVYRYLLGIRINLRIKPRRRIKREKTGGLIRSDGE
jgi:hypothetical protein